MARIKEVNRQLTMLVDNSDRGFPVHMNLALADRNLKSKQLAANVDDNADEEMKRILRRLKDQNHQLTEVLRRLIMDIFPTNYSIFRATFFRLVYM